MPIADNSDRYWSIDVPGLTERGANWLAAGVRDKEIGLPLSLVNPDLFLTLHLDRESVEVLRSALARLESSALRDGLLEEFSDWLNGE